MLTVLIRLRNTPLPYKELQGDVMLNGSSGESGLRARSHGPGKPESILYRDLMLNGSSDQRDEGNALTGDQKLCGARG